MYPLCFLKGGSFCCDFNDLGCGIFIITYLVGQSGRSQALKLKLNSKEIYYYPVAPAPQALKLKLNPKEIYYYPNSLYII